MTVLEADCIEAMREMPEASADAIVTDPPYGLEFMGKDWDRLSNQPGYVERGRITDRPDAQVPYGRGGGVNSYQAGRPMQDWHFVWATEALHVLKPGGHLLAFGGTRTYHRLACAIEDAGFEIRDCLAWLYGSGFPKSRNLNGDRQGWGTALKPAHEPIVLARKPLIGTVAANVQEHGTGALNVDGCRVEVREGDEPAAGAGRWPANVVLDPEAAEMLDEQAPDTGGGGFCGGGIGDGLVYGDPGSGQTRRDGRVDPNGGASRFYYCAKAGRAERNAGLDGFEKRPINWSSGEQNPGSFQSEGTEKAARNAHPTVKPISLMRWLCRLVTPPGGTVLDPFTGSGTTGCAAVLEGFDFIGVEREPEYVAIADARIAWWAEHRGREADEVLAISSASERATAEHEARGQMGLIP